MKHKKRAPKGLPHFYGAVKPLVLLTLLGMNVAAQAMLKDFAVIPLHLQTTSTQTSAAGEKPNILIQVDDSGSMDYLPEVDRVRPGGSYIQFKKNGQTISVHSAFTENGPDWEYKVDGIPAKLIKTTQNTKSRLDIIKQALQKVINDGYVNEDKVNVGILTLWGNNNQTKQYAQQVMKNSREFAMKKEEIQAIIENLEANGNTPVVHRYMDAITILKKALQYRCQKSYVVLFSDGDSASAAELPSVDSANQKFTWSNIATTKLGNGRPFETWVASSYLNTYLFPKNMERYTKIPPSTVANNKYTQIEAYHNGNVIKQTFETTKDDLIFPQMFVKNGDSYQWNLAKPQTWDAKQWVDHPDVLPFLANMVYDHDLKTTADGVDKAGKSWDDTELGVDGKPMNMQRIETFAIGFGGGVSPAGDYALNGMSTGNGGKAFKAQSQEDLDAAFKAIFENIQEQNLFIPPASVATVAPSVSYDVTASNLLSGAATIHLNLATGSSEIRFYRLTPSGTSYDVNEGTYGTPSFHQRQVMLNLGNVSTPENKVVWYNNGGENSIVNESNVNNDTFKIPASDAGNKDEWKTALMPWMTRSVDHDNQLNVPSNALKYRNRQNVGDADTRNMGDVLDASLTAIGDVKHNRQEYLITAANDGMLYVFQSQAGDEHPYSLRLNYMPAGMQREKSDDLVMHHFKNIADPNYVISPDKPHEYLLNGDFTVRRTDNSAPRRIFLSGNMGQAGRGSYSVNIDGVQRSDNSKVGLSAESSEWIRSVPLFETPKDPDNKMGYTIGAPQIGRVAMNRTFGQGQPTSVDLNNVFYMTFVNSGVRHPQGGLENTESALYVYNTLGGKENVGLQVDKSITTNDEVGKLMAKITVPEGSGGLAQPAVVDVDLDGVVDVAYAGDYQGNLYRFDLRNNPNGDYTKWKAHRIFQARDKDGKPQPITSAPAVIEQAPNQYVVVFGTGSELYQSDLADRQTQAVYGIYDDLTSDQPMEVQKNQLLQQSLLGSTRSGESVRDLTELAFDPAQYKGWFFELKDAGERVTVKPYTVLKTIVLKTHQYQSNTKKEGSAENEADVCVPSKTTHSTSAKSWVMQFRGDTGGKLPKEGDPDADKFGYVDFAKANATGKYSTRPLESLVAGHQYDGIALLLILTGNQELDQRAVTDFGDTRSGTDPELTPGGKNKNLCWNINANNGVSLTGSSTSTSGSGASHINNVYVKTCDVATLRRISWREIF